MQKVIQPADNKMNNPATPIEVEAAAALRGPIQAAGDCRGVGAGEEGRLRNGAGNPTPLGIPESESSLHVR
jgi:hypothetical protein